MPTYQIVTDGGVYEIETEEPKQIDRTSLEYQASVDPKALALQEMSKGKFIPQMAKAMYEGLPFGKRVISAMPNAEEIKRNIAMTPEAQGFKAGAGKFVGEIAAMAPAIAGAEALIPAKLLASSVGVGAQRGGQVLSEDKGIPQAIGEAALAGGLTFAGGKALEGAGRYIARKIPAQILNPLRPAEEEISKETTKVIKEGIEKAVRPSVIGKRTANQQETYFKKAESAVNDVLDNKQNLEIIDRNGNLSVGKNPENLNEALQAVGQTKEGIFEKYSPMIKKASDAGEVVDGNAIASKLKNFAAQKNVQLSNPNLAKYAEDVATRWDGQKIPLEVAEQTAKDFNAMLKQKYQQGKISGADVSSAHVDDMVVRMLRNEIADKAGVGDLKRRYGALAELEGDLAKRVIVAGRQNPIGLIESVANISSGSDIAGGVMLSIMTQNPAYLGFAAKGIAAKVAGNLVKNANSPDANIAKMFKNVEKLRKIPTRSTLVSAEEVSKRPFQSKGAVSEAMFKENVKGNIGLERPSEIGFQRRPGLPNLPAEGVYRGRTKPIITPASGAGEAVIPMGQKPLTIEQGGQSFLKRPEVIEQGETIIKPKRAIPSRASTGKAPVKGKTVIPKAATAAGVAGIPLIMAGQSEASTNDIIKKQEGGKQIRGGRLISNRGVERPTLNDFNKATGKNYELNKLNDKQTDEVYNWYFKDFNIPDTGHAPFDTILKDSAFHWGKNAATKMIQSIIGVPADGKFGPKSKEAFNKWLDERSFEEAAKAITNKQRAYMKTRKNYINNKNGWEARLKRMEALLAES